MAIKVKQITVSGQVFSRLKESLKKKEWDVNEKIPSEYDLADTYGVSRQTVRVALQRLTGMGLLEARTGDGTYVKEFSFREYIEHVSDFYMSADLLEGVYEFRMVVEVACVELAIENATHDELDKLKLLCKEYGYIKNTLLECCSEESMVALVEKDIELHQHICSMSHNELFIYTFEVVREPIFQYLMAILAKRIDGWNKKSVDFSDWDDLHNEIYTGIITKDLERCKRAYEQMGKYQV